MISPTVKLVEDPGWRAAAKRLLVRDTKGIFDRALPGVRDWCRGEIAARLRRHETYRSLKSGSLAVQLGLGPDQQSRVERCVDYVANSVRAEYSPAVGDSLGSGWVYLLGGGVDGLLAQEFASYVSVSRRGPTTVPWLEWLIRGEGRILVTGFHIQTNIPERAVGSSRTGAALMRPGGSWWMPSGDGGWVESTLEAVAREAGQRLAAAVTGYGYSGTTT